MTIILVPCGSDEWGGVSASLLHLRHYKGRMSVDGGADELGVGISIVIHFAPANVRNGWHSFPGVINEDYVFPGFNGPRQW
jgi:hypothetical protein